MKKRLIYLPLERYKERYTEYLSGGCGIFETQCKKLGVDVFPIRPNNHLHTITAGQVLDPLSRAEWGFEQTIDLLELIQHGLITSEDAIYIEDFWHPGFEMIPYAAQVCTKKRLDIYAFCHAQSVDPNDFTHPMRWWMRDMERGWSHYLSGVFVAAQELKDMLHIGAIDADVYPTGTVFDAEHLQQQYLPRYIQHPKQYIGAKDKLKKVIFSSRWDTEKNPQFFLALVDSVIQERQDIHFMIVSGFKDLRSNDPGLVLSAWEMRQKYPRNLIIKTNLPKQEYYFELATSKVQFNCASQDFVSYTLLEATAFGAAPLYPNYLTFPDALHHKPAHLYEVDNIVDAKAKLYALIDGPVQDYAWVYKKYESSVQRMLRVMDFAVDATPSLEQCIIHGINDSTKSQGA
jgi:glycosyltransferase involved in cell wall biosynthesis